MPGTGPRGHRPDEQVRPVVPADDASEGPSGATSAAVPAETPEELSAAEKRALKFTARNMIWSLLPLTVLVLVMVGWTSLRQPDDPVHPVELDTSLYLASQRADYSLLVPRDLPDGWQPTSVRTDAGAATAPGDPVTLQIGWFTADGEYAAYVISDDADADALTGVLAGATDDGSARVDGVPWQRLTTERGETALTRTEGPATLLVTGSASDEELETLAGSLAPYRG